MTSGVGRLEIIQLQDKVQIAPISRRWVTATATSADTITAAVTNILATTSAVIIATAKSQCGWATTLPVEMPLSATIDLAFLLLLMLHILLFYYY